MQIKDFLPVFQLQDAAAGVVGRAGEHDFGALPYVFGDAFQSGLKDGAGQLAKRISAAAENGCAFVDLVERIGAEDDGFEVV